MALKIKRALKLLLDPYAHFCTSADVSNSSRNRDKGLLRLSLYFDFAFAFQDDLQSLNFNYVFFSKIYK